VDLDFRRKEALMAQSGGGLGSILPILLIGGAAYLVWNYFSAASAAAAAPPAPSPTPTPTPTPSPTPTPPVTTQTNPTMPPTSGVAALTVADAATYPYSSSIPAATIQALNPQLASNLAGGQIATIAGNSVLAYMLGWGGQAAGATETTAAATGGNEIYTYDGTNWNYKASGVSGLFGLGLPRVPRVPRMIHFQPVGKNYVRPGSPMRVGR
jgi:hypothetical protein